MFITGYCRKPLCHRRIIRARARRKLVPIDYQHQDFVKTIHRRTSEGVDVVFDGIGGTHIWRSRKALRSGGRVVAYGLTSSLRGGRLASGGSGVAGGWLLPGRKRVIPYSIQWLKRLKPALFRQDLIALFELLQKRKIKPLIARRFPLAEARHAHELLGMGGLTGKIVLVSNGPSLESGAALQRHAADGVYEANLASNGQCEVILDWC